MGKKKAKGTRREAFVKEEVRGEKNRNSSDDSSASPGDSEGESEYIPHEYYDICAFDRCCNYICFFLLIGVTCVGFPLLLLRCTFVFGEDYCNEEGTDVAGEVRE